MPSESAALAMGHETMLTVRHVTAAARWVEGAQLAEAGNRTGEQEHHTGEYTYLAGCCLYISVPWALGYDEAQSLVVLLKLRLRQRGPVQM